MKLLILTTALIAVSSAQQAAWQQCGGINYSGVTTCITGYTCSYINDLPSLHSPSCTSTITSATTTAVASRSSSSSTTTTQSPVINTTVQTTLITSSTTTSSSSTTTKSSGTGTATVTLGTGNPFAGRTQWANPYYASEVSSIAIPSFISASKPAYATAAAKVASVPSFTWLDTLAKLTSIRPYLQDVRDSGLTSPIVPFVVYNLPDRDCSAAASNGELSLANNGAEIYKSQYIGVIRAALQDFPEIPVVLIIEPDSLANLVANMGVAKCAGAAEAYKALTVYAVKQLALPNVAIYLDGGHGGWLGWPANLYSAAQLFGKIYQDAGSPSNLRGLATNVANYNGWSLATCPSYTSPNTNCDEKRYVEAITSALAEQGWANSHHVVDQGRSGKQPTGQLDQGHWCNAIGTGFGTRPTSNTGHASVDAFVWVKPGGESDGTSDTSAVRYDYHCGVSDALKPAPEAGQWFQAYFEQLLVNAEPSFF